MHQITNKFWLHKLWILCSCIIQIIEKLHYLSEIECLIHTSVLSMKLFTFSKWNQVFLSISSSLMRAFRCYPSITERVKVCFWAVTWASTISLLWISACLCYILSMQIMIIQIYHVIDIDTCAFVMMSLL